MYFFSTPPYLPLLRAELKARETDISSARGNANEKNFSDIHKLIIKEYIGNVRYLWGMLRECESLMVKAPSAQQFLGAGLLGAVVLIGRFL